jgi:hypothetical protein
MSWAIERDAEGQPIRMWWMGVAKAPEDPVMIPVPWCAECGFSKGWHKLGCSSLKKRAPEGALVR